MKDCPRCRGINGLWLNADGEPTCIYCGFVLQEPPPEYMLYEEAVSGRHRRREPNRAEGKL